MNVFVFDNEKHNVNVNQPEILLVKEFAALWEKGRNKTKEDPKGELRLRARKEFTYIWLAIDWQSPYSEFVPKDRHEEAMADSGLTQKEFDDPIFRAACRKYQQMQDENLSLKMLAAAKNTVIKFIDYFNNIDPEERDDITHKPIYKVKDIMVELNQLDDLHKTLQDLTKRVKKDREAVSANRGGEENGYEPSENDL